LKPEVGVSYAWRKFYFDLYAGGWFFTENSDFYPGGSAKQQDPLTALQAHVSYTIRPRMWLALDSTWYGGGAVSLDDGPSENRASNSRIGATLSLPIVAHQSLKIAYSGGASVRSGSNFKSVNVAWQFQWF
jgi:hypothetical protein